VRVEAGAEAERRNPAAEGIDVSHLSHDGPRRQLLDLAWLIARHPLRVLTDLGARRRWRREEPVRPLRALACAARRVARHGDQHLHAHFAAGAALDALRISLLLGIPYSVTAHAYDIYLSPANLREKLERAAFATSGCEYTVRDLRAIAPAAHIHEIVMGVDGRSFERVRPYPGGRTVVAVGRLVEKKGFVHLIEAAALLRGSAPLETVTIVGDGPLREELAIRVRELGLDDTIELAGVATPVEVRELLQDADLLVMPCVIAGNGDRDSMPVVVKEAMAMEVPVVASDEVGLPELVRPAFGRLVPPGDPVALAGAIEELLALPAKRRAEMGAAGRAFVLEHCDVMHETQRLADLMAAP
jgi:glycosyltransferase involved in cell wall biosynthesis